jgi:N-acetylneuraminic acid mutarotase
VKRTLIGLLLACGLLGSLGADARAAGWQSLAPLPEVRAEAGAASVGGDLYVAGGLGPYDAQSATAPTESTVFRYDGDAGSWSQVAPLPVALAGIRLVSSGGSLYALGASDRNLAGSAPSIDVERYDPASDAWSSVTTEPRPREGEVLAGVGRSGRIWVVGGVRPGTSAIRRRVDVYDPGTGEWGSRHPLPRRGVPLAMTATRAGVMEVFMRGPKRVRMLSYRGARGWVAESTVPNPGGIFMWAGLTAITAAHGRIYLIGGYTEVFSLAVADNMTFVYDTHTRRWSFGPPPPTRGGAPAVARLGTRIVVAGGIDDQASQPVNTVTALDTR